MDLHDWHQWIGLPHRIGADPRTDGAACCLVITKILVTEAGYPMPAIDDWIELAHQESWDELRNAFYRHCEEIPSAEPWSLTLLETGDPAGEYALGLGVVVPGPFLLMPHHRSGVQALPLRTLRGTPAFYKLRNV